MELTDEQIDEAAFRMAMETTREGLEADLATDGVAFTWTKSGMRARAAAREFGAAVLDDSSPASALTRAWEAASGEGQVVS